MRKIIHEVAAPFVLRGAGVFDIETLHYIVKPVVKKQFYYMLDIFFDGYTSMRMLTVNGR